MAVDAFNRVLCELIVVLSFLSVAIFHGHYSCRGARLAPLQVPVSGNKINGRIPYAPTTKSSNACATLVRVDVRITAAHLSFKTGRATFAASGS